MDTKEFLQLVTADGIRCVAMQVEKGFVQFPADDVESAAKLAAWMDGKQKNAYYALATFKETYTNATGKERVKRKRKNCDKLKSLWVDIDYKDCTPADQTGALQAVQRFLAETDWPKPTAMVSSGNGMHLYWPLSDPLGLQEWLPLAEGFKDLCKQAGLPADHACTADAARVLRPVGTHNWKDPSNPKAVVWLGGSGECFDSTELREKLHTAGVCRESTQSNVGRHGQVDNAELPEHLRKAVGGNSGAEYTKGNERSQHPGQAVRKCGVLRHILKTGGADQDEPEWNATMMLLAHLDDGPKLVHPMSKGHPDYDPDTTMEKWGQKVEAVEDGSGPTLCVTFEGYHEDICKACPFYQSKKVKTPKSLAYMAPATPKTYTTPQLVSVPGTQATYPFQYRVGGNNDCIERKKWDQEAGQYEWEPVLRQVWEVTKATRLIQSNEYQTEVINKNGNNTSRFMIPNWQLGSADLTKTIAQNGCSIVDANELKEFKKFMQTWLDELREKALVEDVTGQLGWIRDIDEDEQPITGFACGTTAYYLDGSTREGVVSAEGKYKGIMESFKVQGKPEPWEEAAEAIVEQGCDHLIALLSTAFAAPLMRFTDQPGAVVSVVSNDSAAGKSTGLRLAQAVWGNPRHAPATMDDTPTVVKNKLAFLQNLPAYWDEVRGDEHKMTQFVQIAFQVAQGRDRERANSKAETIRAMEWQTLLAACSNESLFDLAAEKAAESNAGIYRIFEVAVSPAEYPAHDAEIMSLMSQVDRNFGHAGQVYAKYLVDNYEQIENEVAVARIEFEKMAKLQGPERFWIAALTAMVLGAKYAGKAGIIDIDTKRLTKYLMKGLQSLRARAVLGKQRLSPRELVASYAQQHMDGKVVVNHIPDGKGRPDNVVLEGNHAHVRKAMFVEGKEDNAMLVLKSDFRTWLLKSKGVKWNDKVTKEFETDVQMIEKKCQLAAGTKFKLPRAICLQFKLEETDNAE